MDNAPSAVACHRRPDGLMPSMPHQARRCFKASVTRGMEMVKTQAAACAWVDSAMGGGDQGLVNKVSVMTSEYLPATSGTPLAGTAKVNWRGPLIAPPI